MAAASSDWKHPSDHPPPDNSWVLIRHINGYVGTGKYVRGTWRMTGKTGAVSPKSITHWAQIYKPPKDDPIADRDRLIQHIKDHHANNQTEQPTTIETSKDICKGSQTSQATQIITTHSTPTIEA